MKFFKKETVIRNAEADQPAHAADHMVINRQQLSLLLSFALLLSIVVFISGYFIGQRQAIEQFSSQIDQESLADTIYTSLYSLTDNHALDTSASQEASQLSDTDVSLQSQQEQTKVAGELNPSAKKHYAALAGFGSQHGAALFAHKMNNQGIPVSIKTRYSKTMRGRKIAWYQVVTAPYDSRDELQEIVDKLIREQRLHDVRFVTI
jgi:hypothetical protein